MTNDELEDGIDALLRQQFDGPVPADEFCDRVMSQLPARWRRTQWPLPAGVLAGTAACGASLWFAPITDVAWQNWASGELSQSAIALFIAIAGMAMLAMAWAVTEADDRYGASLKLSSP